MTCDAGSSGDLLADRRFRYGQALAAEGDHRAAADLFGQAVELAPIWAAGWFALGEARARCDDGTGAREAFERAAALDPEGRLGARLALTALGAVPVPADAGASHVRALFDAYAPRFDAHLVEGLAYRAPKLLLAALDEIAPGRRFGRAWDLGCGTGLMGAALRSRVAWLGGVDLSPNMAAQARAKGVYDVLQVGDMIAALRDDPEPCDLIVAADVLVYVGDLGPVFAAVRARLGEDGLFAFSIQRPPEDIDVHVGPDRRFAHSRRHVFARAQENGLAVAVSQETSTRRDAGVDVPGAIVVLRR